MSHLQPSPLEPTLEIESLIRLGAIENTLHRHTHTISIITTPQNSLLRKKKMNIPYSTPPAQQHNPTPE